MLQNCRGSGDLHLLLERTSMTPHNKLEKDVTLNYVIIWRYSRVSIPILRDGQGGGI